MDRNKYALYRKIRHDRTYRTLGKMSWWRIVLGSALLLSILFFTGTVSQPVAARGNFRLAEKLLLFPAWMETYRPEEKAYLDAGVLYQDGDYASALEIFSALEHPSAPTMRSRSALKLAEEQLAAGDAAAAADALEEIDVSLLTESEAELYQTLSAALSAEDAA